MMIYIALLRGINVGGHRKVKMAELKQLFERLGLQQVRTYIQSGNVLFRSETDERTLRSMLEEEIASAYGFEVTVVIRTVEELRRIAEGCPFSDGEIREAEAASDAESLYVAMLTEKPAADNVVRIQSFESEQEKLRIIGRDAYMLLHQSIRNAKLAGQLHQLAVPATTRNWKTIHKLLALAVAMAD